MVVSSSILHRFYRFAAVLCLAMVVASCTRIPRQRTLPPSIRKISVPMFVNRSAEPSLEEDATVYTQEEFLADGRLDLVRPNDADAIINVKIRDYDTGTVGFDSNDFAQYTQISVMAYIEVVRNVPGRPILGGNREVTAKTIWNSDERYIRYEPEPLARERVLRELARLIVQEVITGEFNPEE